ncbi:RNA-guided endonuclease InsQ/TnpB family protein [Anaerostipes hadrus]|uniref:RNA-guided endonuclease InsQ/TnpB family protein n=1 Tax=Anaerostipes hadrus TaxID=649756 RepID=UPI0036F20085
MSEHAFLKEVRIKPYHGRFLFCLTFEEPEPVIETSMPYTCAIDFGTDNFAAIVCDDGSSVIYKGGAVLSDTQWFHKQKAKYVSILTKGYKNQYAASKRSSDLSYHHANFVKDQCHKISRSIIDFCVDHQAGTLIFGVNPLWKQNSRIGKINNQKFVSMPIAFLRAMITYKALNAGIKIIEQEESYTSKADIATKDYIPTYGVDDKDAQFSGLRIKRGLYRCADGTILNADCHAAANIMRKAIPDIWKDTRDYTFLSAPDVYGFHKLNPKGIPVKGIAA